MHRLYTLALSIIMLTQSMGFGLDDIINLKILFEHYEMHKAEYGDTLYSFFEKHYGDQRKEHDGMHDEHEKLPFSHANVHLATVYITPLSFEVLKNETSPIHKGDSFFYTDNYNFTQRADIFQPPRLS